MFRLHRPVNWRLLPRNRLSVRHIHPSKPTQSSQPSQASRINRITSKLPRGLQKYTSGLQNAPVSHAISFLILHELTAIVPLLGLFGLFHYTDYLPLSYVTQHFGGYVEAGAVRFEKYFRRKGWFGFDMGDAVTPQTSGSDEQKTGGVIQQWQSGEPRYKILVEVALAYAITKALLPVRIIWSVWATPWFANNVLLRLRRTFASKH